MSDVSDNECDPEVLVNYEAKHSSQRLKRKNSPTVHVACAAKKNCVEKPVTAIDKKRAEDAKQFSARIKDVKDMLMHLRSRLMNLQKCR